MKDVENPNFITGNLINQNEFGMNYRFTCSGHTTWAMNERGLRQLLGTALNPRY